MGSDDAIRTDRTAEPSHEAPLPLAPDRLCRRCDPASLAFDRVEELPDPPLLFGQERAMSAIQVGMAMSRAGYNIFLL
jgi:hypothetical protein